MENLQVTKSRTADLRNGLQAVENLIIGMDLRALQDRLRVEQKEHLEKVRINIVENIVL